MEDENEYKKLPTEDKCVHKLWKARVAGYEEANKLFNQIDDEKSPEWNKYLGLIKKFVADSNAVAQEKGMEAALVFVENCGHAGKTTGEVMSGIVAKCIAAPRTKTKDLALQITLMYVEIEKHEIVQEELMKGMDQKNPKVVAACISALNSALKQFGNKVITIKPMVKKIPVLLADRDKTVRDEMKALVVEMHRWIGAAIEPHISSLQAVVQQELRESFGGGGGAQPERHLRSQQHRAARENNADTRNLGAEEEDEPDEGAGDSGDADPFDLMDPVEILSKLPKDFYDKLENKKWQERKEALDALDALLKTAPRLEPGDYADMVRALKKTISKDSNVMLVALAGRLLGALASGLRQRFQPYAVACIQAILEKFKEKKPNVVAALKDAADAIYESTNLEAIMEDMLAAFENKNPSVKSEAALFLARSLCRTPPAAFGKKLLKAYVASLLKLLESAEPTVRDAASEALGTATKLVGEKNIAPHIGKIDPLKEQKIKEFADKAVLKVKAVPAKKEAKKGAPSAKGDSKSSAGSTQPKPVKKPTGKVAPVKKATGGSKKAAPSPPRELPLSEEEVDMAAEQLFSADVITGLSDSNWKTRLSAVQSFLQTVQTLGSGDATAQLLLRILNKKPGLRDTNVQVLRARLEAAKYIADNYPLTIVAVDCVLGDIVVKLGESNCASLCSDCLTAMCDACGLDHVVATALSHAMDQQKSPKVQAELLNWLSPTLKQFGNTLSVKTVLPYLKKALSATNPQVRGACASFVGVWSLYVGPALLAHFDGEKAPLRQLLQQEVDRHADSEPPPPQPSRAKSASRDSVADDLDEDASEGAEPAATRDEPRATTDLAPLITEALLQEINDKNWKVRNEALDKLKAIITSAAPIKASLGELPPALVARLLDSNLKIAQSTLHICQQLASALGPRCKHHSRTFFPAFFQAFGDNKQWIRASAVACVAAWCAQGGAHLPFDGEMVCDALKGGSPMLRATLLSWLEEHLPTVPLKSFPKEELSICVATLYACIEERAAEVRKAAADCVLPFMLHLGYEAMHKQLDKLKPGSKAVILAALDKARPSLPVQPLPKTKKEDAKGVKTAGAMKKDAEKKPGTATKGKLVKPSSASSRNKKEDEDFSPLLPVNNSKNQRIIDDQKLKVLKWNFTTPREEFFELLKEQMTSAGVNKQLIANMFHADFRYHLKALESLTEELESGSSALAGNLDLVLKWLTLRFFDTNPCVILKGLEYLTLAFGALLQQDYTMPEYEAHCFIPYLVLKVGDPKDAVRNGVKALFKQICVLYSVTKLFGYLMEGLKSKNARQRAECLECIGHLLETYGSSVLPSSAGAPLKELARHIGDRDNAVRSAALNCVANAYFLEGEKVYKMIGQISDKDMSLLEERIKRCGKTRAAEVRRSMVVPLSNTGKPISQPPVIEESPKHVISVETPLGADAEDAEDSQPEMPAAPAAPAEPTVVPGPFRLNPALIAELDAAAPRPARSSLRQLDLQFLDEPIPVPPPHRATMVPLTPPRLPQPTLLARALTQTQPALALPAMDDAQLADTIHSIASPDCNAAIRALSLVAGALSSGRGAALAPYSERLVSSVATQVRRLRTTPPPADHHNAYKYIASALLAFYDTSSCGASVGEEAIAQLLSELLLVLGRRGGVSGGAAVGGAQDAERLVRLLNNVCVKLLEHSPRTPLLCAIISLLHSSIGTSDPEHPKYRDLLLKCFWKTLKMIPQWDTDALDYSAVLTKIHLFYKAYPNSYWKSGAQDDTPYRTVKTLVHTLVKKKGAAIMEHVVAIPDINESDLYPYLLKVFKQVKVDDKKENSCDATSVGGVLSNAAAQNAALNAARLPRAVHEKLAVILKMIGANEHNRDALVMLYELRDRHPEVDIWACMQGSSFYFRNYVERGLREVAEQRRLASLSVYKHELSDKCDISNENEEKSHVVFLEKLRALQAKAGMKTDMTSATPCDNRVLTDSVNENLPRCIDPQLELHSATASTPRNEPDMGALRLKLQQIKSASRR